MGNDTEALIINDDVSRVIFVILVTDSMFWMTEQVFHLFWNANNYYGKDILELKKLLTVKEPLCFVWGEGSRFSFNLSSIGTSETHLHFLCYSSFKKMM